MGEELIEKVFVGDDSLLISKSFEVDESLVVAFLFARKSKNSFPICKKVQKDDSMKLAFFSWLGLKSIKSLGSTVSDWADIIIIIGSVNH